MLSLFFLSILYKNISLSKSKVRFINSNISFSIFATYLTWLGINKNRLKKIMFLKNDKNKSYQFFHQKFLIYLFIEKVY